MLERETGVPLLERAGRGVRLTDAALVLVEHAEALLERTALAEADLAAAAGTVAGRGAHRGLRVRGAASCAAGDGGARARGPAAALRAGRGSSPRRRSRCSRSATSTSSSRTSGSISRSGYPRAWSATTCSSDPVRLVLPRATLRRAAIRTPCRSPSWPATPGPPATPAGLGRDDAPHLPELGGFEPDVRHRTNDAAISLAVVASGLAVTMLPDLALPPRRPGVTLRDIADRPMHRAIFAATRAADAARPSTQALLAAVREAVAPLRRGY